MSVIKDEFHAWQHDKERGDPGTFCSQGCYWDCEHREGRTIFRTDELMFKVKQSSAQGSQPAPVSLNVANALQGNSEPQLLHIEYDRDFWITR